MLDLEVQPERSLGNEQWEFILGMPFKQAVNILKRQDRIIKGVQFWYSDQNPLVTDQLINLSKDGIRLIFDSSTQRLKMIEVYEMTRVKLKYCGTTFNAQPNIQPTIDQIDHCFGATHPGDYIKEKQIFRLKFRGLTFEFRIDSRSEPRYSHGLGQLQFSNGASPLVSRMFIYAGNSPEDPSPTHMPLQCFHGNCYLDHLEVERVRNLTTAFKFFLVTEGNGPAKLSELRRVSCEKTVRFGDTVEDVTAALGCPSKVFYKGEDKMKIHSPDGHKLVRSHCSDYFYNYATLGVDILLDSIVHRVKKVVLHTNFPGHYDFNEYYRCEFKIPVVVERPVRGDENAWKKGSKTQTLQLEYHTKWESVQPLLVASDRKPVILKRAASTNTTNPFGSTFSWGVQDMIFEVMQNGHIASVTFYQPRSLSVNSPKEGATNA